MPEYSIAKIIIAIDKFLTQMHKTSTDPVEANAMLAQKGILEDDDIHPGLPLRSILRKGEIPHAYQPGGKKTEWVIPHSSRGQWR